MRLHGPSPQAEPIRNRGQKRDSKGETQEYRTVGQQNRRSVVFIAWSNEWHESSTALTLREIAPNRQAQASALLIVNNDAQQRGLPLRDMPPFWSPRRRRTANLETARLKAEPSRKHHRVYSSRARKVINSARSTSIVLTCARTSASMAVRSLIISTLSLVPSLPVVVSAAIVFGSGFSFR